MGRQYRWTLDGDSVIIVGSSAGDRPVTEKQADLLEWSEDQERLEAWKAAASGANADPAGGEVRGE